MSCTEPGISNAQFITNIAGTCRVCMIKNNSMEEIFASDYKIVERIYFCTGIHFTENPNFPSLICKKCLSQLNIAHNFKTKCIAADEVFREMDVKLEIKTENIDHDDVKTEFENLFEDEIDAEELKEDVGLLIEKDLKPVNVIESPNPVCSKKINLTSLNHTNKSTLKMKGKCKENKTENSTKETKTCKKDKRKTPRNRVVTQIKFRKLFCGSCKIRFESKEESLEHHERMHNTSKFVCEVCGKQFVYQASHTAHMRIHAGPAFTCAHCSYATVNKSDLKTHLTLHTGEKKFHCHVCPGAFRTSSNLQNHIRHKHGGQKMFPCERCDKSFFTGHRLRRHMDAHNNIKRYECPVCHSCFSRRCHWKTHLLKQHAVRTPPAKPGRPGPGRLHKDTPSLFDATINIQKYGHLLFCVRF